MDNENRIKCVSTRANVNIALLKYWGKKEEELKLPFQTSIALTLDDLYTDSTLTRDPALKADELFLNGKKASKIEQDKIAHYLDLVRKLYKRKGFIRIESINHVPTAAGLASSASAYASIALGLNDLFELNLDKKGLSALARLGSGSASRSIYGGFSLWIPGDSHETSVATQIVSDWQDLVFIVVLLSEKQKAISSREAMKKSVKLPSYQTFVERSMRMVDPMLKAILEKNLISLGHLMEESSDLLHATIRDTGYDFYLPSTYEFLEKLKEIKNDYPLFYTIDAGPNVKLLTTKAYVKDILARLKDYKTLVCHIGGEAHVNS